MLSKVRGRLLTAEWRKQCCRAARTSLAGGDGTGPRRPLVAGDEVTVTRTVTQGDVERFGDVTGDRNPVHYGGKGAIVHGALLNGVVSGVLGTRLPGPGTRVVAQRLEFPNPCYVGDEVTITVTVTSARKIVVCTFVCVTSHDQKTVLRGEAKVVMRSQ